MHFGNIWAKRFVSEFKLVQPKLWLRVQPLTRPFCGGAGYRRRLARRGFFPSCAMEWRNFLATAAKIAEAFVLAAPAGKPKDSAVRKFILENLTQQEVVIYSF